MSSRLNLSKPDRTIRAGVILMNGVTELLDVAPFDFLACLGKQSIAQFPEGVFPEELREQALDIECHWVNEKGGPAKLTGGLTVQPTDSFETCPPLDIVLMGAHNMGYMPNDAELNFIRKSYDDCTEFITICGGSHAPMMAGLLHGKTATAPRPVLEMLKQTVPDVSWVDQRWHRDGKLWTSGALLNGTDLMRAFAMETWGGGDTLANAMLDIGGFPRRDVDYKDA